jgi:hypothetical protein
MAPPPRIVLCVPGPWSSIHELTDRLGSGFQNGAWKDEKGRLLAKLDFRAGRNDRMEGSFEVNALPQNATLPPGDVRAVAAHVSVAYLVSAPLLREDTVRIASEMVRLGRAVLDAGGIAIKCESSGLGHSKAGWARLSEKLATGKDVLWDLHSAFVAYPMRDGDDLYTCGMHLLGYPDAIALVENDGEGAYLLKWFTLYLLDEAAQHPVASGHTFRPAEGAPRYRIQLEDCRLYEPDRFFFNPYGMWRLSPAS